MSPGSQPFYVQYHHYNRTNTMQDQHNAVASPTQYQCRLNPLQKPRSLTGGVLPSALSRNNSTCFNFSFTVVDVKRNLYSMRNKEVIHKKSHSYSRTDSVVSKVIFILSMLYKLALHLHFRLKHHLKWFIFIKYSNYIIKCNATPIWTMTSLVCARFKFYYQLMISCYIFLYYQIIHSLS